jgi:hypothetical protein
MQTLGATPSTDAQQSRADEALRGGGGGGFSDEEKEEVREEGIVDLTNESDGDVEEEDPEGDWVPYDHGRGLSLANNLQHV